MNSFEWNKIIGAVLGTAVFIFVVRLVAEHVYEPEHPEKPGYVVEGVVETPAGGGAPAAPVAEVMPDWGTVLPAADVAAGQASTAKCAACHDFAKGGPNKIGPNLFAVVDRPRGGHEGFSYSAAFKAKPGNWTYDDLYKFIKSPGAFIPGTKMSFAGISKSDDRVALITFLHSNAAAPAPIPAPKPAAAAPAAAPADGAAPAPAPNAKGGAPVAAPAPAAH